MGVRFPYGLLAKHESERGEAWISRLVGGQEIVGSNPTFLTDETFRAEVQMGARLFWEQEPRLREKRRFDPELPDSNGSRGLVAPSLIDTGG